MEQKRKQAKAQTGWGIDIISKEQVFKWAEESEVQEKSQDKKCPITSGAAAAITRKRTREMAEDYSKPNYAETKFHIKKIEITKLGATLKIRSGSSSHNNPSAPRSDGVNEKGNTEEKQPDRDHRDARDHRDRSLKYTGTSYQNMLTFLGAGGDRKQETKGIG